MLKYILALFLILNTLISFAQSENGVRVFSGKCNASQVGSGTGYWTVAITNFNDPGGGDAADIQVGDYLAFNDSGKEFQLYITQINSASGSSANFRVSNTSIVGISSVPTTSAYISRRTANFGLSPKIANISDNDDQLQSEYTMYKIDSLLNKALGANWFSTTDTLVFSPSGKTPSNGDFAWWKNRGQLMEKKNGYWNKVTSKNGENINSANKVTVAYGALGVTSFNLSNGNYFYTSCNGDITINAANEVLQSTNNSVVIEVFNNTEDYIDATFQSGKFVQFGTSDLDGSAIDMPRCRISAYGTRLFKFTVVNLGEIAFLVSDQIDGSATGSWYTPTITKNLSTDTIVTTYTHNYTRVGNVVTLAGKVLVNNTAGTVSSSFRISMPPSITSDFTNIDNDVQGTVTNRKFVTPATIYAAYPYADITNNQVTIAYDCDTDATKRQTINYTVIFKIQ